MGSRRRGGNRLFTGPGQSAPMSARSTLPPRLAADPLAPTLSVVVPAYNEAASLPAFHARLRAVLDASLERWECLIVDDGSTDATVAVAEALREDDPRLGLLVLSRNFGKEIALTAGLDRARGQAVVLIDADLQDPP